MLGKAKEWSRDNAPRSLFSFVSQAYWKLLPERMEITLSFDKDDELEEHWVDKKKDDGIGLHFPSRNLLSGMTVKRSYQRSLRLSRKSIAFYAGSAMS